MRSLFSAILLLAAGCTTLPDALVATPKDVTMAVPGKCIKKKDVPKTPVFPLDAVEFDGQQDLARLTHAARLERKARQEYVATIEKVLEKCSD